jgi:hypothetical protein
MLKNRRERAEGKAIGAQDARHINVDRRASAHRATQLSARAADLFSVSPVKGGGGRSFFLSSAAFFQMATDKILLAVMLLANAAYAEEEALGRSSHPRGFVEGGALPPIIRPAGNQSGGKAAGATTVQEQRVQSPGAASGQAAAGGVNILGNTRIDARAQGATAAAIGQQNTSSNRTGAIGGK